MSKIEILKQWINESNRIVFFGGAGVSTESGIPDFRSVDGLYNQKFEYPKDFNPRKYYDHVVGIYVNEDLPIVKLKLRVYGVQMEYMRMLPLHKSQSEVKSRYGEFAEFTYRLCLTQIGRASCRERVS